MGFFSLFSIASINFYFFYLRIFLANFRQKFIWDQNIKRRIDEILKQNNLFCYWDYEKQYELQVWSYATTGPNGSHWL